MPVEINWKIGFEMELMAPQGRSRFDLARKTAQRVGGSSARFFHPESEYSAVEGKPVFENLTLGYRVEDPRGAWVASFVDDLTLQAGLDREARPQAGWYRIVSDDARLLRLAEVHCNASAPLEEVLTPLAQLFDSEAKIHPEGMVRVSDRIGASIAIGAPLPGERERPCEIVTAPIAADHQAALSNLLGDAKTLGFTVPRESATHLHFDGAPLCSAAFIARFVPLMRAHGPALQQLVGTNPACVRLGDWPQDLHKAVAKPDFAALTWDEARAVMIGCNLNKYCDYNLANLINQTPDKHTLEVRILPGSMDADEIVQYAALFEAILNHCLSDAPLATEGDIHGLLTKLPLASNCAQYWIERA